MQPSVDLSAVAYLVVVLRQTVIVRRDRGHELGAGEEEHLLKRLQFTLLQRSHLLLELLSQL